MSGVRVSHETFMVAGCSRAAEAHIRYDTQLARFSARYRWSSGKDGLLRLGRSADQNHSKPDAGRPIGFLLAWLHAPASQPDINSQEAHQALTTRVLASHPAVSWAARRHWREWAMTQPSLKDLLQRRYEALRYKAPGAEPDTVVYF